MPDHWLSILWKLKIQLNLTIFYVFFCETERRLDIPIFWLPTFYGGKVIGNKYYKQLLIDSGGVSTWVYAGAVLPRSTL